MSNLLVSFSQIASYVWYLFLAVLVLLIMITVHELGHFIAGKILGFGIEEFSIGFGPKLFQKIKKDGEKFSVRLFPFGGYCAFCGESEDCSDSKAFNNKHPFKRIIVLISGVFMNYIFALVLICLMFGIYGQNALMTYKTVNGAEISEYGFSDGDIILEAESKSVYLSTDIMSRIENKKEGDLVLFKVLRDGKETEIKIKLLCNTDFKNVEDTEKLCKAIGISYSLDDSGNVLDSGFRSTAIKLGFFKVIGKSVEYSFKLMASLFIVFGQLFRGSLGISSLGGTFTTVITTAQVIKTGGFRYLLNIASFIGVNLALFNILPIPALDGSRVIFTVIEWIRGKPVNRKVENFIHTLGFFLILLFAIIVDLQRCF